MKCLFNTAVALVALTFAAATFAHQNRTEGTIKLSYNDGREATSGLIEINNVLKPIGVRVNEVALPRAAKSLLKTSQNRALNEEEAAKLISHFALHRGQLLDIISDAGRQPEAHRGGYLTTSEVGVAPYPKVYDMKALTPKVMEYLQEKFGRLDFPGFTRHWLIPNNTPLHI